MRVANKGVKTAAAQSLGLPRLELKALSPDLDITAEGGLGT